eukprot:772173-Prymnesium_polylepis.4
MEASLAVMPLLGIGESQPTCAVLTCVYTEPMCDLVEFIQQGFQFLAEDFSIAKVCDFVSSTFALAKRFSESLGEAISRNTTWDRGVDQALEQVNEICVKIDGIVKDVEASCAAVDANGLARARRERPPIWVRHSLRCLNNSPHRWCGDEHLLYHCSGHFFRQAFGEVSTTLSHLHNGIKYF